jgi:membrane protease YdiL (CAAX protease family)
MEQNSTDRLKYVTWMFIPTALAFILQFIASAIVMEGAVAYSIGTFKGDTFNELISYMMDLMLSSVSNGLIFVLYAVAGIIIFAYNFHSMFMKGKSYSIKGISSNIPATIGGIVLFSIGMQYVSNYLMNAMGSAFPALLQEYEELLETAGLTEEISVPMAIYALILGPVVEELMFRGITLSSAKKLMPYQVAILVQAILFGAFHMNAIQGAYAFVLGLGLGYIMHLYDNLFFTIIIHIAYNIIGTIGSAFLPMGGDTLVTFFLWVLGALVVSYVGLILLRIGAASVNYSEPEADI